MNLREKNSALSACSLPLVWMTAPAEAHVARWPQACRLARAYSASCWPGFWVRRVLARTPDYCTPLAVSSMSLRLGFFIGNHFLPNRVTMRRKSNRVCEVLTPGRKQ